MQQNMSVGVFLALVLSSATASIISTQFHAQDGRGGYTYGHYGGPSAKIEQGTADGTVFGSYSYIDGNGIVQSAVYSADAVNGFRVLASNLPVAPNAPPAPALLPISSSVNRPLGVPVVDTPEVSAAKAAHLAAVERQKQVISSYPSRRRRDVVSYLPFGHTSLVHLPFGVYKPTYAYPLASVDTDGVPVPVTDTPEVAAAKSAHLSAVKQAKLILGVE